MSVEFGLDNNFYKWATSLSGCDGGNANADIWLCGIEWGGASYNDGEYYKNLHKEIEAGKVTPETSFDWKDSLTYTYGRSFAKLYTAFKNEKVENYENFVIEKSNEHELFKLNLYPIAFDSTDDALWKKYELNKITGFDEKDLFQTWCIFNRFPEFTKLRIEKKPKLIICTGISYMKDFIMCFGWGEKKLHIQYGELEPKSESNKYIRRYYWVKLGDDTTLVVIPFFSGSYGLNSNHLLQEMGMKIRELCML